MIIPNVEHLFSHRSLPQTGSQFVIKGRCDACTEDTLQSNGVQYCCLRPAWGRRNEYGEGSSTDYAVATDWYRKGHEKGNARGTHNLGHLYEQQIIPVPDAEDQGANAHLLLAARYFEQAADQDLGDSHYALGRLYEQHASVFGYSANEARSLAIQHYRRAVELGYANAEPALKNLGVGR